MADFHLAKFRRTHFPEKIQLRLHTFYHRLGLAGIEIFREKTAFALLFFQNNIGDDLKATQILGRKKLDYHIGAGRLAHAL